MALTGLRKDIQELKHAAALEKKRSEDSRIENMTDEELRSAIEDDIRSMGFESEAHYLDCAKKFILKKDPHANVTHDYAVHKHIAELCEDFKILEEFMLKYSSLECLKNEPAVSEE